MLYGNWCLSGWHEQGSFQASSKDAACPWLPFFATDVLDVARSFAQNACASQSLQRLPFWQQQISDRCISIALSPKFIVMCHRPCRSQPTIGRTVVCPPNASALTLSMQAWWQIVV